MRANKSKIGVSNLCLGLLLMASFIASPIQALDFGKTLEDLTKQKVEELKKGGDGISSDKSSSSSAPATPSSSSSSEPTPTDAKTQQVAKTATTGAAPIMSDSPEFNWKKPSKEEEIALGREITGSILGAAPLVKDEVLQRYVNQVGRWVANQSERADLPWKFGVIESADLNAFAAPGGYVLITKGLYQKITNEAQLAGVLGHEIAHVLKKHQLKVLQKQQLLNFGAGKLNDLLGKNDKLAKKVIGSGAEISARGLDKEAEFEADRIGMVLATRAGYDTYGLADILQVIGQTNQADSSVALLFKTHPSPDERLNQLSTSAGSSFDNVKEGKALQNRFYVLK